MNTADSVRPKTSLGQKFVLISSGLLLSLVLLEGGLRLGGMIFFSIQEYRNQASMRSHGEVRILCLGESTTANQYPVFLQETLNKSRGDIRFSVIDKGIPGANTSIIIDELEADLKRYRPQVVVAMMGINDSGEHMPVDLRNVGNTRGGWKSLRVYKLLDLLVLHMRTQLRTSLKRSATAASKSSRNDTMTIPQTPHLSATQPDAEPLLHEAMVLQEHGDYVKAEKLLQDFVRKYPRDSYAFARLGWGCFTLKRVPVSVNYFRKAVKLDPRNHWALVGLGISYKQLRQYKEAEAALLKAIALKPQDDWAYIELTNCYFREGRFQTAEIMLKAALGRCDRKDRLYGALASIGSMNGNGDNLAPGLNSSYFYTDKTVQNYKILKSRLDQKGIRLVCVQYPVRSVALLKTLFDSNDNVVFVDNEQVFKTAVKEHGYWEYFIDSFAGDFGHCTDRGNRLLAENIAMVLLKEVVAQ